MTKIKVFALLGVALVATLFYAGRASLTSEFTETFARDSERVCSSSGNTNCKYVAFGENETYENTDTWMFLKFNSSDIEKDLVKGNTCFIKVYGIRFPFFSWYRNIIEAACGKAK